MGQDNSKAAELAAERAKATRKLRSGLYQAQAHDDAINGILVPQALGLEVTRKCVIRGILHNSGFGEELRGIREAPEFTRALNARKIMDDKIPKMKEDWEFPYCFWYPTLPNTRTLKKLARRYPQLKYNVGRACAVKGIWPQTIGLALVPEVSIAEEARDNGYMGLYHEIMSHPIQYAVLDDYTRTANIDGKPAKLSGNTAVRSSLDVKQAHRNPNERNDFGFDKPYFDICEDAGIGTRDHRPNGPTTEGTAKYLHKPLPDHLPPIQKDNLIVAAAFNGDIDRWYRLRRPVLVPNELDALIRGIHHSVFFARHMADLQKNHNGSEEAMALERATTARYIMSNDLSRVTPSTHPSELPYNIWFPNVASQTTYTTLLKRKPEMAGAVARASIVADYKGVFDEALGVIMRAPSMPDISLPSLVDGPVIARDLALLLHEALASPNPHYKEALQRSMTAREGLESKVEKAREELRGWETIRASDFARVASSETPGARASARFGADISGMYDGKNPSIGLLEAQNMEYLRGLNITRSPP